MTAKLHKEPMDSPKKRTVLQKALVAVFLIVFALFVVYAVSDIVTSRQTYHLGETDRIVSKVALVAIDVFTFGSMFLFFGFDRQRLLLLLKKQLLFLISLFGICLCIFVSYFFHRVSFSTLLTQLIYPLSILLISVWFCVSVDMGIVRKPVIKFLLVFLFYLYLFFCIFYFFYVLGKPMASGGLRTPIISHVFFCCALLPSLRNFLPFRQMLIVYLSFLPMVFLGDKASVLIIYFVFLLADLYRVYIARLGRKYKIGIFIGCSVAVFLVLIISNVWVGSFLYNLLSFQSVIFQSGRLQNWSRILSDVQNFRFQDIVFGKGIGATLLVNDGTAAHNDYVEFFYDFGILGLAFLFLFVVSVVIFALKAPKGKGTRSSFLCLFYVVLLTLISSFFSNSNLLLSLSLIPNNASLGGPFDGEETYWNIVI